MKAAYPLSKPYTTAFLPWAWPYGGEDRFYYRGRYYQFRDPTQDEPWKILVAQEREERIAARLKAGKAAAALRSRR